MSKSLRLLACLALILIAPIALASDSTPVCGSGTVNASAPVHPVTGLPMSIIPTANFFKCSSAFTSASFCNQCWAALNQCSGPDCYACTETCLARLGCWIP